MLRNTRFSLLLVLTMISCCACTGGRTQEDKAPDPEKEFLLEMWEPDTYEALCTLMEDVKEGDYAVFDFDNTMIIGDISDAVFQYQVEHLRFAFDPKDFFSVVTAAIPDIDRPLDDSGVTYRDLASSASVHYLGARMLSSSPFADYSVLETFRAEMLALVHFAYTVFGDDAGNLTLFGLMTGMTQEEQRTLALEAADVALEPTLLSLEFWNTEAFSLPMVRGMGITPEMRSLVMALRRAGVRVCICSASAQPMVEAVAEREFGIPAADVFGIRFQHDSAGRMEQRYLPDYPVTLKEGKVECINRLISPDGRSPILVAGDSDGDYQMLTAYPDLRLGLIIDKDQTEGLLLPLLTQARQHPGHPYCGQYRAANLKWLVPNGPSLELL